MKLITAFTLLFIAIVVGFPAHACTPLAHDPIDDSAKANSIVVGYVTGHKQVGYEAHLLAGGNPDSGQIGDVLVRVAPIEAIKGQKPAQVVEVISDCPGTWPKDGNRVVLVQTTGLTVLVETPGYEAELRRALQSGR